MSPTDRFNTVLAENNLGVRLAPFTTRMLQDGAFLVEKPVLEIFFLNPQKEELLKEPDEQKSES